MAHIINFFDAKKRLETQTIKVSKSLTPEQEYAVVCTWLRKSAKVLRLVNINDNSVKTYKIEDYHRNNQDRPMRIQFVPRTCK